MGEIYLYRLDFARVIPIYWYFGKRNPKKTNKIFELRFLFITFAAVSSNY